MSTSPLPWRNENGELVDANSDRIFAPSDLELIVRAVNCFEELVEACRIARQRFAPAVVELNRVLDKAAAEPEKRRP